MRRILLSLFAVMSVAVFVTGCELAKDPNIEVVQNTAKSFGAEIAKEDYKAARAFLLKDFIWFDSKEKQHGSVEGKSGKTSFLSMLHDAKSGGSYSLTVDSTKKISDTRYLVIATNTVASGSWQIRMSFGKNGDEWELLEAKELSTRPKGGKGSEFAVPPTIKASSDLAKQPQVGGGDKSYLLEEAQAGDGSALGAKKAIIDKIGTEGLKPKR